MNFNCLELSIIDDQDFGCTIKLSDTINNDYENEPSIEEILNSKEKYFLLQRSYPESSNEINWYSIDTTESDDELGQKDLIFIKFINNELLEVSWNCTTVNIGLQINEEDKSNFRKVLQRRFKKVVRLIEE